MSRADRAVIVTVALGAVLAPLNSTMIAVALLPIVDDFETPLGSAGWLVTSYLLAVAVVLPLAGKLGDRHGRRPFVLGGLLAFGLASLGAAVAPNLALLIAFRVTQAVAGAVVFPNGIGLIRESIAAERRGRAFGIVGGSLALAAGLGPPLGGLLVMLGGWRAVFYVNLPLVAVALVMAWRTVPRHSGRRPATPFDWLGAVLLAVVLGGAAALVVEGRHAPTVLVPGIPLLVLAAFVFVRRELGHADPVFQPRFYTRRAFAAANGGVSSSNLAFYTMLLAIPILLTRHLHWSFVQTGLALALLSAPTVVFSPIGGRLADRHGRRRPAVIGCVIFTVGLVPLAVAPGITAYGCSPLSRSRVRASACPTLDCRQRPWRQSIPSKRVSPQASSRPPATSAASPPRSRSHACSTRGTGSPASKRCSRSPSRQPLSRRGDARAPRHDRRLAAPSPDSAVLPGKSGVAEVPGRNRTSARGLGNAVVRRRNSVEAAYEHVPFRLRCVVNRDYEGRTETARRARQVTLTEMSP